MTADRLRISVSVVVVAVVGVFAVSFALLWLGMLIRWVSNSANDEAAFALVGVAVTAYWLHEWIRPWAERVWPSLRHVECPDCGADWQPSKGECPNCETWARFPELSEDVEYVPSSDWLDQLQEPEANDSAGVSRRRLYFYALLKPSGHQPRSDWFEAASLEEAVAKAHERHGPRVLKVSPEARHSPDAAEVLSGLIADGNEEADAAMAATDCEHGCRMDGGDRCPHGFQSAARTLGLI